jgi:two-component system chemotaxis response regulator CheY
MMRRSQVATGRAANAERQAPRVPSILVVEADDDVRTLYRESLAIAGWDVVEASDGRDGLVKLLMNPPSLVITELNLPFIDGYGLCEVLRHDQGTAHVPILVVTTEARPAQIVRAQRAGADVVLIKPTPPEQMLTEARGLLARAKDLRGRAAAMSAGVAVQFDASANVAARGEGHSRTTLSKSFPRMATTTPPASPPALVCPSCDRPLSYERSEIGGVSRRHPEQWDYYSCDSCGTFQHRQRTRRLRRIS